MRYFEKIFHVIVISGFIGLVAGAAHANSFTTTGKLIRKEPIYTQVTQQTPVNECYTVDVPVYGNVQGGGDAAGGALAGMIIGGILGKGVTGKDNGAAAGAVIGGLIGADKGANTSKRVVTGYRQEQRCEQRYINEQKTIANQYRLVYLVDGHEFAYTVNKAQGRNAWVGQTKRFRIRYQMLD
jgi:uncharacterized protein YcfJ